MPSKDPHPQLWTLRFKQHKTVILLFVEGGQSFTSIKSNLLEAIKNSGRNGQPLPSDPEDILLGIPVDRNDISRGWAALEIPEGDANGQTIVKQKSGYKEKVLTASPLGAGLKDGAMVAFKFKKSTSEPDSETDDSGWDVVIPSYEEEDAQARESAA